MELYDTVRVLGRLEGVLDLLDLVLRMFLHWDDGV